MAKKPIDLGGTVDPTARPADTGAAQRGATPKPPTKRAGEKRLTLALDRTTYRRLRLHAVDTDRTHQDILEAALAEYLNRASA